MNEYVDSLPYLEINESSQPTDNWDLMHIVHVVQRNPLKQVQKFSYMHTVKIAR